MMGCHRSARLHAPRTLSDTVAGIVVRHDPNRPVFYVHCVECHGDFGPYFTLAEAQAVGRECYDCARRKIARLRRGGKG